MSNIRKVKKVYEALKIPEEIDYTINRGISNGKYKKKYMFTHIKYAISTMACTFFAFVFLVNINPTFASSISDVPILRDIARVFTIKEIKEEDKEKLINAKIPALENTGNTELEKRVNYEIMLKINKILDEVNQRAAEYKRAVIETGGKEQDYQPINILIDYKVGYSTDNLVSFIILKTEILASAYTEMFFYNIDIQTGKELNLRDIFGSDYKNIIDEEIYKQIEERSKNPNNIYFTKDEGGFEGIENEYQDFYINENGKVVIVFEKYEIAPGYMGTQEFEIDKQINL